MESFVLWVRSHANNSPRPKCSEQLLLCPEPPIHLREGIHHLRSNSITTKEGLPGGYPAKQRGGARTGSRSRRRHSTDARGDVAIQILTKTIGRRLFLSVQNTQLHFYLLLPSPRPPFPLLFRRREDHDFSSDCWRCG